MSEAGAGAGKPGRPDDGEAPEIGGTAQGVAPDGRPWVHPLTRAAWRTWLVEHHLTSKGVHLVTWRRPTGRARVEYEDAVEEALCVGWIDSTLRRLDPDRTMLWFAPRRPGSVWARSNKERVTRLAAAGRMLPAGLAAVEEAKRTGAWTILDEVEALIVPDDLGEALDGRPPARRHWDTASRSTRQRLLWWIRQAKRPETRAKRVRETTEMALRDELIAR